MNEVTIEVSSEKTVSVSMLIVLVSSISLPFEVHQMTISLKNQLRKRFIEIEENELIAQASILDPRFKKYGFMNDGKFKNTFTILRTCLGNISLPSNQLDNNEHTPSISTLTTSPPVLLLWKIYEEKVEKFKTTRSAASGIIELDKYIQVFNRSSRWSFEILVWT